ncbi:MAG: hypothetical protein QM674_22160 [Burkholderiaceae bacterium]
MRLAIALPVPGVLIHPGLLRPGLVLAVGRITVQPLSLPTPATLALTARLRAQALVRTLRARLERHVARNASLAGHRRLSRHKTVFHDVSHAPGFKHYSKRKLEGQVRSQVRDWCGYRTGQR